MSSSDCVQPRCVLVGGGGHGAAVIDWIQAGAADMQVRGVVDRDETRWGTVLLGVPVLGGDHLLADLRRQGVEWFVVGVGGTKDNGPRQRLFDQAIAAGLEPWTVIHPSAVVARSAILGAGSVVGPGAVINARAVIGRNVIVNTRSVIEHDCEIGDHVHVATGAVLASTVSVGRRAHIGAGAVVRQSVAVGADAVVGAGAVVVRDVSAEQVVVGVPARPMQRADGRMRGSEATL